MRQGLGIAISALLWCLPVQVVLTEAVQSQSVADRKAEADRLFELGNQQYNKSQYREALQAWQSALAIYRAIQDRNGEGASLNNLGNAYDSLGQYQKAIEYHQQSLAIAKQLDNLKEEGNSLNGLGLAYDSLGQYQKAIEYHQQSLAIAKQLSDLNGEGASLNNLGNAYDSLGQYQKAIDYHQQSLAIAKQLGDLNSEGASLNGLGLAYGSLGQHRKAIEYHQQSLAIAKQLGDLTGEGVSLNSLGLAYDSLGQYQKAIDFYQQSLVIAQQLGDRNSEGVSLNNLGFIFRTLKQPELAILFYKQSVNVRESIRKDLRGLSQADQKSYLSIVEPTYRNLADLLLKQERILEAQQILDLLKVQELSDYFRTVRGNSETAKGTDLQRPEQTIIALGKELASLQKLDRDGKLQPPQQQRLAYLTTQESDRNQQFNAFLKSPEVQKQIEELRRVEQSQNVDLEKFNRLRASLTKIQNAALFYPLILGDRLELVLITATTPPIRKTINLKRETLNAAISEFLLSLKNPDSSQVKQDGQKFYTWLIKPFEAELQEAQIQTLIYAPDGPLRYLPLAALYNGKQWLIEKYRINNITASSLSDLTPRPHSKPRVLAAAATNSHEIKVGDRSLPFGALPAAKTEVEAIAARLPRTTVLIDQKFTKPETLPKMQSHNVVHLATHGHFAVGNPEDSFIIFGDGDKATLRDMENWTLTNVDLVVLSACETAISGKVGNGIEILGLGYQIQNAGARAAIASLWKVSDDGTQTLMQAFYQELSQGNVSSAEALRRAQIALIRGNQPGGSEFSHPYYWSAFILIGNGL